MSDGAHHRTAAALAGTGAARIAAAGDLDTLRELETEFLGKRSELSGLKSAMRDMDPEQRRSFGAELNAAREQLDAAVRGESVPRPARLRQSTRPQP